MQENLLEKIFSSQYNSSSIVPGPYGDRLLTYSDYIASGQPIKMIEEYIQENVFPYYANTHTEASYTGFYTSHLREDARNTIKQCVNANENDVVIFCGSGSTAAFDKMNRLLESRNKTKGENIIIFYGPYEHHSNILPWREGSFEAIAINIDSKGLIDLDDLKNKLAQYQGKGTLIGSFSAASNVTGIIAPIDEITNLLHQHGALSFWDYAAGAPYMKIDMNPGTNLQKDAIFISTHKFIGGPGTPGILIAKRNLFSNEVPIVPSGGTVDFVTRTKQKYSDDVETREEGGTPGIIESIRAGLCFKLKNEIGEEEIDKRESDAVSYVFEKLKPNPNVLILGNTECKRLAFFAFLIRNKEKFLHHNFVVALLNDLFGIQSRGGCSCAGPYGLDLMNMSNEKSNEYMVELATGNVGIKPGWVRLNINYFIPNYEVKYIVTAIEWIAENGHALLKEYHFDDNTGLWQNKHAEKVLLGKPIDFKTFSTNKQTKEPIDRAKEQNRYLIEADEILAKAKLNWDSTPLQSYDYNQVENPLRWYALAQDQ